MVDRDDLARLEAEHRDMTDRELMLRVLARTNETLGLIRDQNGKVASLTIKVDGDPVAPDLRPGNSREIKRAHDRLDLHDDLLNRARGAVAMIAILGGVIGAVAGTVGANILGG